MTTPEQQLAPQINSSRPYTEVQGKYPQFSQFAKRIIDVTGSAVLLSLLSPVLGLVTFLILVFDGSPVIYRRRVVGKNGEFDAFKFRTMRRDADVILEQDPMLRAEFSRNFKLKDDPRVTRVGALLRKFSLDELPQLFNVFLGQMSLVGPRMFTAVELEKYGGYGGLVLSVKPGLTGYWQVNGRQNVTYEERVRMDVYYVQHWDLLLDLKILLQTPLKVVKREGAF